MTVIFARILSYDGRSGNRSYGKPLPAKLHLKLVEIEAGRSSQATLLGRKEMTVESLSLSPALADELEAQPAIHRESTALSFQHLRSHNVSGAAQCDSHM
ncbi:MAG: hypothetical protein ACLQVY_18960 [Limisphaerales bacterium]